MKGSQAIFGTENNRVTKKYTDCETNKLSSVAHELKMFRRFRESKYCPIIYEKLSDGYIMQEYDFSLGSITEIDESKVREVLFFSPDIIEQLKEIRADLERYKVIHRDINPGNLLYSIKDRCLKLIDFYWAVKEGSELINIPGLNGTYKDDSSAFLQLEAQVQEIKGRVSNDLVRNERAFDNIGIRYSDGSSVTKGYAYHQLPYKSDIKIHKLSCIEEYRIIKKHIDFPIKTVKDMGCAQGYFMFNMLRDYGVNIIGWESDPYVHTFLTGLIDIFNIGDRTTINPLFDDNTILTPSNVTIFMNIHMWLHKQLGIGRSETLMRNIAATTGVMFFQTAHQESESMHVVEYLENETSIINMLTRCGFSDITRILITSGHGKIRYMFKCKGMLSLKYNFKKPAIKPFNNPEKKKVLCIMTIYNEIDFLPYKVEWCRRNGLDLYVIDNYSTDYSYEWLKAHNINCHRVDTKGTFDLRILQNEILKTTNEIKPDWVVYCGADLFIFTEKPIINLCMEAEAVGKNIIGFPLINMCYAGEKREGNIFTTFFQYKKMHQIEFVYKWSGAIEYNGDVIKIPDRNPFECDGVMINYGKIKTPERRKEIIHRRRLAWLMGLDRSFGRHYLSEERRKFRQFNKDELKDIRKSVHWKYLEKYLLNK